MKLRVLHTDFRHKHESKYEYECVTSHYYQPSKNIKIKCNHKNNFAYMKYLQRSRGINSIRVEKKTK
jgi:hypothetical protein